MGRLAEQCRDQGHRRLAGFDEGKSSDGLEGEDEDEDEDPQKKLMKRE